MAFAHLVPAAKGTGIASCIAEYVSPKQAFAGPAGELRQHLVEDGGNIEIWGRLLQGQPSRTEVDIHCWCLGRMQEHCDLSLPGPCAT